MRLEQAAAGSWPVHTGVVQGSGRLLQAMVTACKGSHDAVVRVYEALLRWVWECWVWMWACLGDSAGGCARSAQCRECGEHA